MKNKLTKNPKEYIKEEALAFIEKLYPKRDPSIDPCPCGTQRCYPAMCEVYLAHREWRKQK